MAGLVFLALCFGGPLVFAAGPERIGGGEMPRPKRDNPYHNYPKAFNGRGILDEIQKENLVISDSLYKMDDDMSFNIPGQNDVSDTFFEKGQAVAFVLNENGEIVSLWKLKKLDDLIEK